MTKYPSASEKSLTGAMSRHRAEMARQAVVRASSRRVITLPDAPGVRWEMLTPPGVRLEMFVRFVEPGGSSGASMHTHAGDDTGLILQGRLRLELGGDAWTSGWATR